MLIGTDNFTDGGLIGKGTEIRIPGFEVDLAIIIMIEIIVK